MNFTMKAVTKSVMRPGLWFLLLGLILTGCKSVRPYEKEWLLSPLMDDAALQDLDPRLARDGILRFERLAGVTGSTAGSACPTCGG